MRIIFPFFNNKLRHILPLRPIDINEFDDVLLSFKLNYYYSDSGKSIIPLFIRSFSVFFCSGNVL